MKSIHNIYLSFFILLAAILIIGCGEEEKETTQVVKPVKTVTVSGFGEGEITFPATVEAGEKLLMSFRIPGRIVQLPVKEGEEVNRGQLIARLDPKDYQIAINEARAEFNKAEADLKRYQKLYERDAVLKKPKKTWLTLT
jgi:multidrug efflux pump subunit AcrA (membrane-fusion protein)